MMPRKYSRFSKILCIIAALTIPLITCVSLERLIPTVKAAVSYTGTSKPMEFYVHYLDAPVRVAGLETKYIMNTIRSFRFSTQQEAYANAFYKPIGLPKIEVDFHLYPNLAGPVTIDGIWQVFLWVNGSAYKPTGFTLQFKEITVGGVVLWDSGQISPTVTSSIGAYINVPVYNYNLSTPLNHTFVANTTLLVAVEINAGSSATTRIWYDSPLYPSKIVLPAKDYARPVDVKTYAYDRSETNLFYYNWSANQRIVIVRANVTDPFGGYDIHNVSMTIIDPVGNTIVDGSDMVRKSDDQWLLCSSHVFEANWSYPSTVQLGNYTVKISVIDNNGYYRGLDTGSSTPFIEYSTYGFSIGIIVYYNPDIRVVDDVGIPLPNALVYITWPNGSRDMFPRYTAADGFVNLTNVVQGYYGITILWKDVVVKQATNYFDSDEPYTVKTEVYQLRISLKGVDGVAIQGAYIIIYYTKTGVGYWFATTNSTGQAVFKLPGDMYNIEVHYNAEYWLKAVTANATEMAVPVNTSTSKTIVLTAFPPPIWTTIGFWLIIAVVVQGVELTIVYTKLLRRRHRA